MPELGPYGSVRGALSNERPYRELRNVGANYPFERSHRFAGIQPNSGHRDYSRLSCGVGETQLEPMPGSTSLGGAYSVGSLSRFGAAWWWVSLIVARRAQSMGGAARAVG